MNYILPEDVEYQEVKRPARRELGDCPRLPEQVYEKRYEKLYEKMDEDGLDVAVVYGDREHYSNFRYLAAFDPRFEEGVLVAHRNGKNYVLLGNECLNLYRECKVAAEPVLCQILSLPNQPMDEFQSMEESFRRAGIREGMKTGVVGWKLFTGRAEGNIFDVPSYMVDALKEVAGDENVRNATGMFIDPERGIRTVNDVHTIAVLEHGAAEASGCLIDMLEALEPGKSEVELGAYLNPKGKVMSCHPLLAVGANRERGLVSVTDYRVQRGDAFCASMGLEGGLSCRAGYVAEGIEDLKKGAGDYLEKLAKPYFAAVATWYENIGIGMTGGEIYQAVQSIIPKEKYGWVLNPGHLIGSEEWLSSPFYPGSGIGLKSGMLIQMDIIPGMEGYGGPNCEDGICIADEGLQKELEENYPEVWERMNARKRYMKEELGIALKPEVFPMSDIAGWFNPFALNKDGGLSVKRSSNCFSNLSSQQGLFR